MPEKRQQKQSRGKDDSAYPAVHRPVKPQVGADQRPVVVRDRLVHGTDDRGAEAQFRQRQHAEDGGEKPVQPQIRRSHQPQEKRPVQKREQQSEPPVDSAGDDVPAGVFGKIQLHFLHQHVRFAMN